MIFAPLRRTPIAAEGFASGARSLVQALSRHSCTRNGPAGGKDLLLSITVSCVVRTGKKRTPAHWTGAQVQAVFAGDGGEVLPGDGKTYWITNVKRQAALRLLVKYFLSVDVGTIRKLALREHDGTEHGEGAVLFDDGLVGRQVEVRAERAGRRRLKRRGRGDGADGGEQNESGADHHHFPSGPGRLIRVAEQPRRAMPCHVT